MTALAPDPAAQVAAVEAINDPAGQLAEIERLLLTRAPVALNQALFLARAKPLYEALHPETKRGGDRKSRQYRDAEKSNRSILRFDFCDKNQLDSQNKLRRAVRLRNGFCAVWAERLGVTDRWIEMTVAVGQAFDPAEIAALRGSCIENNAEALRTVAGLPPQRRAVLFACMRRDPTRSFRAALIEARLVAARDDDARMLQRLIDLWEDAPARVRRRFLQQIGRADLADAVLRPRQEGAA
jgi:ParB family chromosome partitioning protein